MTNPSSGDQSGWPGQQGYSGYGQQPADQQGYGSSAYPTQQGYGQAAHGQSAPWPAPAAAPGAHGASSWSGAAPAGGYPAGAGGAGSRGPAPGFVAAMTDFGFTSFATPAVIRVLYILNVVLIGLGLLFVLFSAISAFGLNSPGLGLFILASGAVGLLVTLIYTRVILELIYAVVRIAEDVRNLRDRQQ